MNLCYDHVAVVSYAFSCSGTFFVEYHFPVAVAVRGGRGRKGGLFPPPHEVVRVASKRIKKRGVAYFSFLHGGAYQLVEWSPR